MIGKEEFKRLIGNYYEFDEELEKFEVVIPTFFESQLVNTFWDLFETTVKILFTEEGRDWIGAYIYENCRVWYDSDNVEHRLETIDDLWELVKDYQK